MKIIKYFFQFIAIYIFFILFKIIGYKLSTNIGAILGRLIGPLTRSKKIILKNLETALPNLKEEEKKKIIRNMWANYGQILSNYVYIKDFYSSKLDKFIKIEGLEILSSVKNSNQPVVFVSGHFNNFELMAMYLTKSNINLAAIYRPLNNIFLNKVMEKIRVNYICRNQIKKGLSGVRQIFKLLKKNHSIALMIDQRVSQGISSNFFGKPSWTTTMPAQLIKRFNCKVVPIHIERYKKYNFKITVSEPIKFDEKESISTITSKLNILIEEMILKNPDQWIWSHNRWK